MKKVLLILLNLVFVIFIITGLLLIFNKKPDLFAYFSSSKNLDIIKITQSPETADLPIEEEPLIIEEVKKQKPAEKEIKGLYVTAYSASSQTKMDSLIKFAKETELNAMVIDIKDYSGVLAYDSGIELINQLDNDWDLIKDLPALIEKLHNEGIYVIARQTVFQDPELTKKKPEWAVKNINTGGIWYDYKGLSWADPTQQEVWDYNLTIAKEAIELGFDEVNFDYIRFPSDGPMAAMRFKNLEGRTKAEVIADFFKFLHDNLKDEPAYISGDLFGFTTERDDDMNIGQQIEDAALYFDYVCPMIYPSHYPSGHLGLSNPATKPYPVIEHALITGVESIATVENARAKIRPWLQAFNMGAVYTPAMIDAQIQASNENGGYGYMLWNARNVYEYAPLKKNIFPL